LSQADCVGDSESAGAYRHTISTFGMSDHGPVLMNLEVHGLTDVAVLAGV